jgi:hypothetical protein
MNKNETITNVSSRGLSQRKIRSFLPPPLRGEGRGGGGVLQVNYSYLSKTPPSPYPLPPRGEGNNINNILKI